jgi:hypothetical protein
MLMRHFAPKSVSLFAWMMVESSRSYRPANFPNRARSNARRQITRGILEDSYPSHRVTGYPLPCGWKIDYSKGGLDWEAGEETMVSLPISAADAGRQQIKRLTSTCLTDSSVIGGITLWVR